MNKSTDLKRPQSNILSVSNTPLSPHSSIRAVSLPDDPHAGAGHQRGGDGHHVGRHARYLHCDAASRGHAGRQDWQL